MSGTKEGGIKSRDKNLARDPQHYQRIGSKGGKGRTKPHGFSLMTPEQRSAAGRKGGLASKRRKRVSA